MQYDYIAYNNQFTRIQKTGATVYTAIKNTDNGEYYIYNLAYNIVSNTYEEAPANIVISGIIILIACAYIIISIGHKKGREGIYTNELDRIPYELIILAIGALLVIEIWVLGMIMDVSSSVYSKSMVNMGIIACIVMGLAIYITLALTGVTTVRRIKAKMFWKNTLIYKFIKWIKSIINLLIENKNLTLRLIVIYGGFILIQGILILFGAANPIWWIPLLVFWIYIFKLILQDAKAFNKIRGKIRRIYQGETEDDELNLKEFNKEKKQVAEELNDISGGLSNAIEEAMKSERLKTELITNVSHDIKTPLTSIINYVDLMKKENIENNKVREYLEVLDSKSQRLKKLTEDLVEASKASSGNIKLNIEKLNLKELISQVSGEFKDKFEKRGLELIEDLPEEELHINADSRYMYRVLENVYVNISKYALENSRVYIDVKKKEDLVQIELKNISQDKLNITVDELMQRFVRGDSARTTEGSGLGISIAKSLTELQKGRFNIHLDGDLFKVIIEFKIT